MPRGNNEYTVDGDEHYEKDVPTFRSPSLQFPPHLDEKPRESHTASNDPAKTTFAEMARRYNRRDHPEGEEKPASGPVSLAGLIKLQPNRKRTNRPWRPLQLSDFGDDENSNEVEDSDQDDMDSFTEDFNRQLGFDQGRFTTANTAASPKASLFDLPPLQTSMDMSNVCQRLRHPEHSQCPNAGSSAITGPNSEDISPTNTRYRVVDDYVRLFGKPLPDPIRLQEVEGKEGEVTFIAHPNRDISAHQWSEKIYQWNTIGLYSHTRRKIEGSLASDRLRESTIPYNTIEYFKAVAEQRQESGVPPEDTKPPNSSSSHHVESLHRPHLTDSDHFASLSSTSSSTREQLPKLNHMNPNRSDGSQDMIPASHTVTGETLEDPFIVLTRQPRPVTPNTVDFTRGGTGMTGSMDFGYEFPTRLAVTRTTISSQLPSNVEAQKQLFIQREQERLEALRRGVRTQEHLPQQLREVGFGEEAFSQPNTSAKRLTVARPAGSMSPEEAHDRLKLKNRLVELGDSAQRPSPSISQRVAIPNVQALQGPARSLFPPPGLTVANPNRIVSTLNANAAPYTSTSTFNQHPEESGSEVTAVNTQMAATLRFSDPDITRQPHIRDIVNGLGQEAPTPQNLKGPFFADHMPTTNDPTIPLAFQMEEKTKLETWYHDGQRPARQQEHCNNIMATANADARKASGFNFGAIGDSRAHDPSKFENTPAFFRLYENLAEYVEESQIGFEHDYFTRAWKKPNLHLCDLGPNGNNSFFENNAGPSPRQTRSSVSSRQAFNSKNWSGISLTEAPAQRNARGFGMNGTFGGSSARRY